MRKRLEDFAGEAPIFIDANIFLHHAFGTNDLSVEFLKRVESENIKAYTSALVMEEITFKLVMQSASNFVEKVNLDKLKRFLTDAKNRKKAVGPVEEYMGYIHTLRDMGMRILDVSGDDVAASIRKTKQHGLITADAVHLAVMERKGIRYIATSDEDFNDVDGITTWAPV